MKNKKKVIITVCCILVAAAIAVGVFFIMKNQEKKERELELQQIQSPDNVVATYGELQLLGWEYNYYYMSLYNQAVATANQQIQQYAQQGQTPDKLYYDTSAAPSTQKYTGTDAKDGIVTWADYFKIMAPERGFLIKTLYNEAVSEEAEANGFKLTAEQQDYLDELSAAFVETYKESAEKKGVSVDDYIAEKFGEGVNEERYIQLVKKEQIVQYYLSWYEENEFASVTDDKINEYYNEHREDLDIVDFRGYAVSYHEKSGNTKEQAKVIAEEFLSQVHSEDDFKALALELAPDGYAEYYASDSATLFEFYPSSSVRSLSIAMADWLYDSNRKVGEAQVYDIPSQQCYYIAYVLKPVYKDITPLHSHVRHILVQIDGETTDSMAKAQAEEIYAEWKNGGATEELFIELCKKYTDDTASAETGGLYEDISSDSSYVPEFKNWATSSHTKGDTEIVKTDYGYHIMYYVGSEGGERWIHDIRSNISKDNYNVFFDGVYNGISDNTQRNADYIESLAANLENSITSRI